MDYFLIALTLAALAAAAKSRYDLHKESKRVKVNHVYVGEFTNSLPSDFFDRMVANYSQSQAAFDALSAWLKQEYVNALEALRVETDVNAMSRYQGTCGQAMKAYNLVETVRAEAKRRAVSK